MENFIRELKEKNILISLDKSDLKILFNGDKLPADLIDKLRDQKDQLVEYLSGQQEMVNTIQPASPRESYPLSSSQRILWSLCQLPEANIAYNMPGAYMIEGALDRQALEYSVRSLIQRHESLRTVFRENDRNEVMQFICPVEAAGCQIDYLDLRRQDETGDQINGLVKSCYAKTFDLSRGPLIRISLFRITDVKWLLINVMHHIISDNWSMGILIRELLILYNEHAGNVKASLPPLRIQYKDYAVWQQRELSGQFLLDHLQYWKSQFEGDLPVLDLPVSKPRPPVRTYAGHTMNINVPADLYKGLKLLCMEHGSTLFMGLLSAVNVLLFKYSGAGDIIIGTPVAGREHLDLEDQIGYFINTVALRTRFSGDDSFLELLDRVRLNTLQAYEHQAYPFDILLDQLQIRRDMRRNALFDVLVDFLDGRNVSKVHSRGQGELKVSAYQTGEYLVSKFDLSFIFSEYADGLNLSLEYNTDLFDQETIAVFCNHFERVLASIVVDSSSPVGQLSLVSSSEKTLLTETFNALYDNPADYVPVTSLFAEQAIHAPASIALESRMGCMTYKELNETSGRLAGYLKKMYTIEPDHLVGIMMDRSENMIIAILAVLRAGGAYVPIDPAYPVARKKYIMEDAGIRILITQSDFIFDLDYFEGNTFAVDVQLDAIPTQEDVPETEFLPDKLAYVIYTSGSTGQPKGCAITMGNLSNYIQWANSYYFGNASHPDFGLFTSLSFDLTVTSIFCPLTLGGKLFIYGQQETLQDILQDNFNGSHHLTAIKLTPSHINLLKDMELCCSAIQWAIVGGEKVTVATIKILRQINPSMEIFNEYGPTETTVGCIVKQLTDESPVMIGRPIAGTAVYIFDQGFTLCPVGIPGEICIAGVGVGREYLRNPALTAEKFVANPFKQGERMYKTGDLGKWLADGNIEFIGRKDDQVKIRGYRIETGEVENVLLSHHDIESALVLPYISHSGANELIAYIGSRNHLPIADLRRFLTIKLPAYMLPDHFILLNELPLTPNGKVERKNLPPANGRSLNAGNEYFPPRNETESKLVAIWQEILGKERIGIKDNFFDLGGHSLKATRLASQIHKEFEVKAELKDLFSHTILEDQARWIKQAGNASFTEINPAKVQAGYPLSSSQRRLWVLSQFEEANVSYNIPGAYIFEGDLDLRALQYSFKTIVERHEILRTVFRSTDNGEIFQFVNSSGGAGQEIECLDFRNDGLPAEKIRDRVQSMYSVPFDLVEGPLFRAGLYRLKEDKWIFSYVMHHIISDGWSMEILMDELMQLYNSGLSGKGDPLPFLRIQYKDYAVWQQEQLTGEQLSYHKAYWLDQFSGELPVLELPEDRPRPAIKTYDAGSITKRMDPAVSKKIIDYVHDQGCTLFMGLLAAVGTLLHRYTHQEDIIIGTPIAGRDHADLEDQIGFYANTLALRIRIKTEDSFKSLLGKAKEITFRAHQHQIYPFDELVKELHLHRDASRNPLFDVQVILNDDVGTRKTKGFDGLAVSGYGEAEKLHCVFDMVFTFTRVGDGLHLHIIYNRDIYDKQSVLRMAGHLEGLLEAIAISPDHPTGQLDYLAVNEKNLLLSEFNRQILPVPPHLTLTHLFESSAERSAENIAVVSGETRLTYQQLNDKANLLAGHLRETYGVRPDDIVGIMMDRSEKMIISILAVLKAGAAYVPIAPEYPEIRKDYIITDAGIKVVITETACIFDLPFFRGHIFAIDVQLDTLKISSNGPAVSIKPNNLAYVIYTSGSTGEPKGVMIEHSGIVNTILSQNRIFDIDEHHKGLQFASLSFDASVSEIFTILSCGAALYIVDEETKKNPMAFESYMNKWEIDFATIPPAYQKLLRMEKLLTLKKLITAGEAADIEKLLEFSFRSKVFNAYGPTEASICASVFCLHKTGMGTKRSVPIGAPIFNTAAYILDAVGGLVPIGVIGEIHLAGIGLARGYLNRPDLTKEKFVRNPFLEGEIMYRTGDLGRWLPDGNIDFVGRKDEQVKIRGIRIEPGEIEARLLQHADVKSALVLAREDSTGNKSLTAYLVGDQKMGLADVKNYLRSCLPEYMVPDHLVQIDSFPMNLSGKVDKKSLPSPEGLVADRTAEYTPPGTPLEVSLTKIWEEILAVGKVGIKDDYFELGGSSLKAMILIKKVLDETGISIPMKLLFEGKTIENIARNVVVPHPYLHHRTPPFDFRENSLTTEASYNQLMYFSQWKSASEIVILPYYFPDLHIDAFKIAIYRMVERHESLRTIFIVDSGAIKQKIIPADEWPISIEVNENTVSDEEMGRIIEAENTRKIDTSTAPLFFVKVYHLQKGTYCVLVIMHHIITDGYSGGILKNELMLFYSAEKHKTSAGLDALPFQYRDYTAWQRRFLTSKDGREHQDYWLKRLNNFSQETLFQPYPVIITDDKEKAVGAERIIDGQMWLRIDEFVKQNALTRPILLLGVLNILIYRLTGQCDITMTATVSGRNSRYFGELDISGVIGFFANSIFLRNITEDDIVIIEYLHGVQKNFIQDLHYEAYPFEKLLNEIPDAAPTLLKYTGFFNYHNYNHYQEEEYEISDESRKGKVLQVLPMIRAYGFIISEYKNCLRLQILFDKELYRNANILYIMEHYFSILAQILEEPGLLISGLKPMKNEKLTQGAATEKVKI